MHWTRIYLSGCLFLCENLVLLVLANPEPSPSTASPRGLLASNVPTEISISDGSAEGLDAARPIITPFSVDIRATHGLAKRDDQAASVKLARVHENPPDCATVLFEKCPQVNSRLKLFEPKFNFTDSFCAALTGLSCPGVCAHGTNATKYLNWILPVCDAASSRLNYSDFRLTWQDYAAVANASYLSLFPWDWRVEYNATAALDTADSVSLPSCPSFAAKMLAFAIINIFVFIASLVLGRRDVVYRLTCHCFGKPGSRMWVVTALVTIGLNLGANAVNAAITKSTPGFQQAPIGGLILLWASRPRMAWAIGLLTDVQKEQSIYLTQAVSAVTAEVVLQMIGAFYIGTTLNYARKNEYLLLGHLKFAPHGKDAYMMYAGALLWMCAVGFLLLMAIVLLRSMHAVRQMWMLKRKRGVGWSCCLPHKAYHNNTGPHKTSSEFNEPESSTEGRPSFLQVIFTGQTYRPPPRSFIMEAEELKHLVELLGGNGAYRLAVMPEGRPHDYDEMLQQIISLDQHVQVDRFRLHWQAAIWRSGFSLDASEDMKVLLVFTVLPWIGQWLFWAGFLRMSADLYCPPRLWSNTTVWIIFSTLGVFQGASL